MLASIIKLSRCHFSHTSFLNGRRKISKKLTDEEYQVYLQNLGQLQSERKNSKKAKRQLKRYDSYNKTASKVHGLPKYQNITTINTTTALNLTNLVTNLSKESFRKSNKLIILSGNENIKKALEFRDFVKTLYFSHENNLKVS